MDYCDHCGSPHKWEREHGYAVFTSLPPVTDGDIAEYWKLAREAREGMESSKALESVAASAASEALFLEFRQAWEADPYRDPDVRDFHARADEFGVHCTAELAGKLGFYMLIAPAPKLTPEQREQRNDEIQAALRARGIEGPFKNEFKEPDET